MVEMASVGVCKDPGQGQSCRLMASIFWAEVGREEGLETGPGGGGVRRVESRGAL